MVKKFKKITEGTSVSENQLASAVKESAQQIWLAGLGAFSKAQEEGHKVFEALVKEGVSLQNKTKRVAQDSVSEVSEKMNKVASEFASQATGTWDKLETVFEDRVARALNRLGVPSKREIEALTAQVESLKQKQTAVQPATKTATASPKTTSTAAKTVKAAVKTVKKAVKKTAK
jgi:poly(hydroxyalkanoate) granule-associated protein